MNQNIKSIAIILGVVSLLSACQNRGGIGGRANWSQNGYQNYLNGQFNAAALAEGGRVVGYLSFDQTAGATTFPGSTQAGGIQTGGAPSVGGVSTSGTQTNPLGGTTGGIAGAASVNGGITCKFNILPVTNNQFITGTSQPFAYGYQNNVSASGFRPLPIGGDYTLNCGADSDIATSGTNFVITGGSNNTNVTVIRANAAGAVIGAPAVLDIGPATKASGSAAGIFALLTKQGKEIIFLREYEYPSADGGYQVAVLHSMAVPPGATANDVHLDRKGGILTVPVTYVDGTGAVLYYDINGVVFGVFAPVLTTYNPAFANLTANMNEDIAAEIFFKMSPVSTWDAFDGMGCGIIQATGKVLCTEIVKSVDSEHIPENLPLGSIEAQEAMSQYATADYINLWQPFAQARVNNTIFMASNFRFKDLAIGQDKSNGNTAIYMYGITDTGLYSCHLDKLDPFDCAQSPAMQDLSRMIGPLNTIEMTEDNEMALVTGASGAIACTRWGNFFQCSEGGKIDSRQVIAIGALATTRVDLTALGYDEAVAAATADSSEQKTQ